MKITQWLLLVLSGLIILNLTHVFYFNIFTHSLPYGVYMKVKGVPQRGEYASTCLTSEIAQYGINRGYLAEGKCDTGTVPVLKIIKGLPGDHFVIKEGFLRINGYSYPIIGEDSSGRVLNIFYRQKDGILDKEKYLLLSNFVKNSWDSRYWGPVSIQSLLRPLLIFENVKYPQIHHP